MPKWADYAVVAVSFNADGTHINKLRCRPDNGEDLGSEVTFTRKEVIDMIGKKKTFVTATKNANGKYDKGQDVMTYVLEEHFLKTRKDSSVRDNLDNLPTF